VAVTIFDCEQNSPEWYRARMGIPTASMFGAVMAKGRSGDESKTRRTYMQKLAGELLTGEPMENFTNEHTERGKEWEAEARDLYCFMEDVEAMRVGFVRNGDAGCSPDSFIGERGGLEIKTALAHIQIDRLQRNVLPPEHKAQVQGNLWLTEREWWDFASYSPKLPLFVIRVPRDDGYIANLAGAVKAFNEELAATVEQIERFGAPRPTMDMLRASVAELGSAA
jgi:hypothetical protein